MIRSRLVILQASIAMFFCRLGFAGFIVLRKGLGCRFVINE